MNKEKIISAITRQGILPLYYHADEGITIDILKALYTAGIRVVEYTNRGKQALKNLREIAKERYTQFPDLVLGMGTILDAKSAAKALQNGADFLVSPGYTKELSKFSYNENVLWIPGCFTPTEMLQAQDEGSRMVKIFPANALKPELIKSVHEVFPDILFMPTGGLNAANIEPWFSAGASAVGMGGGLISSSIVENRNWNQLGDDTSALIRQVAGWRSEIK